MTFSFVIAETEIDTGQVDEDDEPIIKTIKHRIRFVDTNRLSTHHLILVLIIYQNYLNVTAKIKRKKQLSYHTMILILLQNVKLVDKELII